MLHTCSRCSRANPSEAQYCYHDGAALMSGSGPVRIGAQPFPQQFVFPNGKACRNFDQLALACQENWPESLEVLQKGYLESFLGGLGRSDLARAAREAARFPDQERGLDQFLGQLPSDVVQPPRLAVEPTVVNLGQLTLGEDRHLEIHLHNQGMRLLQGSVSSDSVWLSVGDGPGTSQKLFQFGKELVIGLHVRGKCLRASNKPIQGKLLIESNAGTIEVIVQAEVPVKPFPVGLFAGARSPRQVAEKAKAHPKEAAKWFECGAVAKWYEDNGWTYPVQGPTASGLAAVQQFFEALGLTPPPKVEVSPKSIALKGEPGDEARATIEVHTVEKRPVYAHASSDQPWLSVQPARLSGRSASIPLIVTPIAHAPGQTLTARLTVRANGNQRFIVQVTLTVGGRAGTTAPAPTAPPPRAETFALDTAPPTVSPPVTLATKQKPDRMYLLPASLLVTALLGVILADLLRTPIPPIDDDEKDRKEILAGDPRIGISFRPDNQRFGIVLLKERDPLNPDAFKRLTFSPQGDTNNTCIKLDGQENLYGQVPGVWATKAREVVKHRKWISAWRYTENIWVTQTVMIIPNESTRLLDTCLIHYLLENRDTVPHKVGLRIMLDTFIGANDGVPFVIPGQPGLMDTKIDIRNYKDIPDFVQALERPDLNDPGTTAHLGLKLPSGLRVNLDHPALEPVNRLVICRWPGNPEERWDFTNRKFWAMNAKNQGDQNDSCVTIFWEYRTMEPGDKRALGFTYGLSKASTEQASRLALTYGPPRPAVGEEFTVTAYVKSPEVGQKVTLKLPDSMSFKEGSTAVQGLDDKGSRDIGQVSWKVVIASSATIGKYLLQAESRGDMHQIRVPVRSRSIFEP